MHRPTAPTAAILAAALLSLSAATATHARADDAPDDLKAGREALSRGDGPSAVTLLESALLAVSSSERNAVLDDLRRAYDRAASQAEAAGDSQRAQLYRENLQIISRARPSAGDSRTPRPPATETESEPLAEESRPTETPPAPPPADPLPAPESAPITPDTADPFVSPVRGDERPASQPEPPASGTGNEERSPNNSPRGGAMNLPRGSSAPSSASPSDPTIGASPVAPETPSTSSGPETISEVLRSADAAFRAQKYEEAGRVYAMLAQRGILPESHKPVWAYCRFVAVARRINAQPSTPAEWSAIHAEIREVRALAPEIWFSEYLRRLATERSAAVGAKPSSYIVRGQSDANGSAPSTSSWKTLETENFRIFHDNPTLASRVAQRAEQARSDLYLYWTGSEPSGPWAPRCDIYLYPNASIYSRMTSQPSDSPGFSTMGLSGGRVVARRINLRADADRLAEAVTPHEVSHIVLADLFPTQQIPRWADEGMAVLAEPADDQANRLSDLKSPLASGRVFRSGAMMTASMPDGRYWDLFMAQSTSLTQFLVQLDTPRRFVTFLRESERLGPEQALRDVYGFEGFDQLHSRWLAHARRNVDAPDEGLIAVRPDAVPRTR